jgi:hypothetical protein
MAVTSAPGADAPRSVRSRPWLFWSRLHFLVRLLGLTGGLLACAAGVLAAVRGQFRALHAAADLAQAWDAIAELAQTAWQAPQQNKAVLLCLAGASTALFTLLIEMLVILAFTAARRSAFGVNAVVQGVLAAVALIAVNLWSFHHFAQVDFTRDRQFTLPAEVRKDLAQLDPNSQTTIIVYNRHKVFGLMPDKPQDDYDSAAERKVIEKVHDLVEQFRTIGPHIRVEVLDTQSRDYKFKERLQEVTEAAASGAASAPRMREEAESLRKIIEAAPENSLFFCGRENDKLRVQQLSFNDFYLLDKTLSQDDHAGRGNLVLLYQGVEPFAHRILRLGEKKPRIAIATIHEVLSTGSQRDIGLRGLRNALEARGFDVMDIVLKKEGNGPLGLEPAVYSFEESTLEGLKRTLRFYESDLDKFQKVRKETAQERAIWEKAADDEKTRASLLKQIVDQAMKRAQDYTQQVQLVDATIQQYRQALLNPPSDAVKARLQRELAQLQEIRPQLAELRDLWKNAVTENAARDQLLRRIIRENVDDLDEDLQHLDQAIADYRQRLAATRAEIAKMNEPALEEQRRMTDLKAKLQRLLADCDLLMVPRMTLRNTASINSNIPPQYYPLDPAQVEAIKEFLKAGKPILACFGPLNWPQGLGGFDEARPDGLEELLTQLGVKMLKQTVLFDAEEQGFAENRAGLTIAGASVEIPPLIWDWRSRDSLPPGSVDLKRPPNRIHAAIRLIARGLGKEEALDIRIRDPRPVYYVPLEPPSLRPLAVAALASPAQPNWAALTMSLMALQQSLDVTAQQLPVDPVFLMTSPQSWNEDQPFPADGRIPQFEQPQRDQDKRKQLKPAVTGLETRRRGPFPIGVAVETTLPHDWYASAADKPARLRLAVIGQGGFFTGKELPAAQEKLFVQTINWLLGRDDRLPRDEHLWSFPRVNESVPPDSPTESLWLWGARLGLPVLFLYLGFVVVLFRRLR